MDDKNLVIISAVILIAISMFTLTQAQAAEILKLGLAGLFGLAIGRKDKS